MFEIDAVDNSPLQNGEKERGGVGESVADVNSGVYGQRDVVKTPKFYIEQGTSVSHYKHDVKAWPTLPIFDPAAHTEHASN